jgi:hypothetical protein
MATSFSGGGSQSTRREPPTLGKQLVNFITCGCESSVPFLVIYKAGCEPTQKGDTWNANQTHPFIFSWSAIIGTKQPKVN